MPVNQFVAGKEAFDAGEQRAFPTHVFEGLVLVRQAQLGPSDLSENGLDLRRDDKLILRFVVIERFLARSIPCRKQQVVREICNDERKHAVESLQAVLSPLQIAFQQDLRVATGAEPVALRLELLSDLEVVVDLAVVQQDTVAVRRALDDWTKAIGLQIKDGQPGHSQVDGIGL
jgi:hypothetical protein